MGWCCPPSTRRGLSPGGEAGDAREKADPRVGFPIGASRAYCEAAFAGAEAPASAPEAAAAGSLGSSNLAPPWLAM